MHACMHRNIDYHKDLQPKPKHRIADAFLEVQDIHLIRIDRYIPYKGTCTNFLLIKILYTHAHVHNHTEMPNPLKRL